MGNGIMLKCCENISKDNQGAFILVDNNEKSDNKDNNIDYEEKKNNINEDNNIQSQDNDNSKLKSTQSNENETIHTNKKFMTEFPKFPSKKKNVFFETKNKLKEINESLIEKIKVFDFLKDKDKKKIKFKESQSSTDFDNKENKKNKNEKTILIYGSKESGKTSFVMKYLENKFDNSYIPSLNDERTIKKCILNNGKIFNLEFIVSNNINELKDADCYFIFYDISNENSFEFAKKIINEIVNINDGKIFLIGNKKDLKNVINEKDINDICNKYKCENFLISVKDNIGISNMMQKFGEIFDYNV